MLARYMLPVVTVAFVLAPSACGAPVESHRSRKQSGTCGSLPNRVQLAQGACCPVNGGGHRRLQTASGGCSLPIVCPSAGCATIYEQFWTDCQHEVFAGFGSNQAVYLTFSEFRESCQDLYGSGSGPVPPPPVFPGVIEQYTSSILVGGSLNAVAGKTTYRLRVDLGAEKSNLYSIFGEASDTPHVPAAWFSPYSASATSPPDYNAISMQAPMAQMPLSAVPPTMASMVTMAQGMVQSELTSYISVGPDHLCQSSMCAQQTPSVNTGSVGTAIANWHTGGGPLTLGQNPSLTTDFALFWMDPSEPEHFQTAHGRFVGGPLIAQLTLPSNQPWFVRLGLQGKSFDHCNGSPCPHGTGGTPQPDWQEEHAVWVHTAPASPTSPCVHAHANGQCCPLGMMGADCTTDVDECASNPCVGVPGSTGCWHGVDEYACL